MSSPRPTIDLDTRIARSPEPLTGDLDGEVVLLSADSDRYFGLNLVGSRVWELLAEPSTASALIERLLEEYAVSRPDCEREVLQFLHEMHDRRLVELAGASPTPGGEPCGSDRSGAMR